LAGAVDYDKALDRPGWREAAGRALLGCDPRGYSFRNSSGSLAILAAIRPRLVAGEQFGRRAATGFAFVITRSSAPGVFVVTLLKK
jgi:hypothetical protein